MDDRKRFLRLILALTIAVGIVLIVFVGHGWWLLSERYLRNKAFAFVIAVFMTILAILIGRYVGSEKARKKLDLKTKYRWYMGWAAYVFLFVISALGTVNVAFVLVDRASIVHHDTGDLRKTYNALLVEANRTLKLASFEKRRANLDAELQHLRVEIDNPNGGHFCGVGQAAERILDRIQLIVPDMPRIRGTGVIPDCDHDKANRIFQAYRDSAYSALIKDTSYQAFRGPEKSAFLDRLQRNVADADNRLLNVDRKVTDIATLYDTSLQNTLAEEANQYATDRAIYADLLRPEKSTLPKEVDVSASQDLGSFAAVIKIFFKRIGNIKTWGYLALALLVDIAAINLLSQLYKLRAESDVRPMRDPTTMHGYSPRFLWVNPSAGWLGRSLRHDR